MQFRAKQIAPPKEWGTFEDLCHALFKFVWQDPLAQKNGRRGQPQTGVDVFGSPNATRQRFWGVQCKGKDSNYGSKAEWKEVLAEVAKAELFSPRLERWIFATTSPTDASLQQAARELSVKREAKGLFSVDVLGWEEIQALMAETPQVVAEFYPEHADHLADAIEALRELPAFENRIAQLLDRANVTSVQPASAHGPAIWETVTFDSNRGLGPALMGYPLGPSDAAACPRLNEVDLVLGQLKVAYSVRVVGEPGAGKSICCYQAARELSSKGFEVRRLVDPEADNIPIAPDPSGKPCLLLIDDAHLLRPHVLRRIEEGANATNLVLTTHNAVDRTSHHGAIALDAKRAVKTIANALRTDFDKTLEAVRLADDQIGDRMMDSDLNDRLDQAEASADRPWQFCFVLGGGWRRSKQAADLARSAGNDLILGAIAMRQLASRDARATRSEILDVCSIAGIDAAALESGVEWLGAQRLIISTAECRTPHQRFASVVLKRILEGQDRSGRAKISQMIEGILCDSRYPYAGVRVLIHELRFAGNYNWTRLIGQSALSIAVERCWAANGPDRNFAALALCDLWDFVEGGPTAVVEPNASTLTKWISAPNDGAYGFGHLLNSLAQRDQKLAERVVADADAEAIATAYSNANPDTAYGLAEMLRSVASVREEVFNAKVKAAIDRDKLRALASHEGFKQEAYVFGKFCASVTWWDDDLALEMAELFVPTAQLVLADDPIEGFNQLSSDFASTVLRVFDVMNVYVGKYKPSRRQCAVARRMCEKVDAKKVAEYISSVRPRHFQSAAHFLHFLARSAPRKYDAALRQLDWNKLNAVIERDWANMPHDTEVFLAMLFARQTTQHLVRTLILENAGKIIRFPPRLVLMAPDVGLTHIANGGVLRLGGNGHVSWDLGGFALAIISEKQPELVESAVAPFIKPIAQALANYCRDGTGPAEGFVRIVILHAPSAWAGVLKSFDYVQGEDCLAKCLGGDEDHRRTAAAIIESAVTLNGPVGDMARRLRERFPKASAPTVAAPLFARKQTRARRKA